MKNILSYSIALISAIAITAFTFSTTGYEPGSEAADFKLKNTDGKMVAMADYKDAKGFIVIFTCNHCPYAMKYETRINALDSMYKAKGYPVIAINPNDTINYPDDSYSEMVKRAKDKHFTYPYLIDVTQQTAKAYGAIKTPHAYILQKEKGKLIVKYIGAIDDNYDDASKVTQKYVESAMSEILSNKEISVKTTKAIGCGIKWYK
ncbi:MAG: thioredoxin family protein [Bacteroidota bacterium]